MNMELREAIGLGLQELVYQDQHTEQAMTWTVKTVKGANVAELLLDLIQTGSFEVHENFTIKVGKEVGIHLKRINNAVEVDFSPPPVIKAQVWGLPSYNIKLEGATVRKDELRLVLGGFKDLTIRLV